jgi:hypothetical protein
LEAAQRIERYTHEVDFTTFSADEMRVDAVVRNLPGCRAAGHARFVMMVGHV